MASATLNVAITVGRGTTLSDRFDQQVVHRGRSARARGRTQARSPQTDRRVPALVPRPVRFRADHDASPAHALVRSAGQRSGVSFGSGARHRAAYAPGKYFHYSNLGYTLLGYLLWALDGRPMPTALRARVLEPLGMNRSEPVITLDMRESSRRAMPALPERSALFRGTAACPKPREWLSPAGPAAWLRRPRDMGRYIQMIANRGRGPNARLLLEQSFELSRGRI